LEKKAVFSSCRRKNKLQAEKFVNGNGSAKSIVEKMDAGAVKIEKPGNKVVEKKKEDEKVSNVVNSAGSAVKEEKKVEKPKEEPKPLESYVLKALTLNKWGDLFIGKENKKALVNGGIFPETGKDYLFKCNPVTKTISFEKVDKIPEKMEEGSYIVHLWPNGSFYHKKTGKECFVSVFGGNIGEVKVNMTIERGNKGWMEKA
jgi:hypothetical protein